MAPTINEISKRIAIDFQNIDTQAKNLLQVLVCGSYKTEEDHNIIKKFRDRQKEKGISGTFLMVIIYIRYVQNINIGYTY